ncbi:hypothetical protein [Paenibacillus eucommiae]|uniref:Uncharacterized protein n=1 Tax=Paenibacillus eucommiae TaxID=1355755 RepID=A0ABS4J741_9BACL|nr:hypothetical protein [Paenibacillus eucommiae]MBP1995625.1 hypothetical protein [Paenibacillus eucommiae]
MFHKTITLRPFADISEYTEGFEIVSAQFGTDGCVYVLLRNHIPERERGVLVPSATKKTYTYKVLYAEDNHIEEVVIKGQHFNYHYVQPLKRHLLLVGARGSYYGAGKYDLNAKVCDYKGNTVREFLLGDGIQSVQVTEEGIIWTSYFDEGVFGNNGWNEPIGANGLLAWDEHGNKLYEDHVADIADCYALNVVNDEETWFYYYTDFLLGCVSGGLQQPKVTFMNPDISGSSGFCTDGYHFLFDGGYGKSGTYILKKNEKPARLTKGHKIHFLNEKAEPLVPLTQDFRGNRVLFCEGNLLYQVSVEELVVY